MCAVGCARGQPVDFNSARHPADKAVRRSRARYFCLGENSLAPKVFEWTGYDLRAELVNVRETLVENWRDAGGYLAQALGQIGRSGMAFVSWVTYVALIPVVTFYLLLDWDRLINNIANLIPRQWADDVGRLVRRCDEVLASFYVGNCWLCFA